MALTEKEANLLNIVKEGMDEPGCGWLHELVDVTPSIKGVLGSLIKKGLVRSSKEDNCYWIELV